MGRDNHDPRVPATRPFKDPSERRPRGPAAAPGSGALLAPTGQSLAFNADDVPKGLIGGALNFTETLLILNAFARGKVGVVVGVVVGVAALCVLVLLSYSIHFGEQLTVQAAIGVVLLVAGIVTFYARSIRSIGADDAATSPAPILLAFGASISWVLAIVAAKYTGLPGAA